MSIDGLWKLVAMEVKDSNSWKTWKEGTQGYLLYDQNCHVSLHLTTGNYSAFKEPFPSFTDTISERALRHLTNNYNYMGTYEIKENVVRHIKLSHSNPSEWGDTAYRKIWFIGDTLFMSPLETNNSSLRLKWIKVN